MALMLQTMVSVKRICVAVTATVLYGQTRFRALVQRPA
jgi:hypothetical protein